MEKEKGGGWGKQRDGDSTNDNGGGEDSPEKAARKEEDASVSVAERPSAKHQLLSSVLGGVEVTNPKTSKDVEQEVV